MLGMLRVLTAVADVDAWSTSVWWSQGLFFVYVRSRSIVALRGELDVCERKVRY